MYCKTLIIKSTQANYHFFYCLTVGTVGYFHLNRYDIIGIDMNKNNL